MQLGSPETQCRQRPGCHHGRNFWTQWGGRLGARCLLCGGRSAETPRGCVGLVDAVGLWSLLWVPSGCPTGMGPRRLPWVLAQGGAGTPWVLASPWWAWGCCRSWGQEQTAWRHHVASPGAAGAPPNRGVLSGAAPAASGHEPTPGDRSHLRVSAAPLGPSAARAEGLSLWLCLPLPVPALLRVTNVSAPKISCGSSATAAVPGTWGDAGTVRSPRSSPGPQGAGGKQAAFPHVQPSDVCSPDVPAPLPGPPRTSAWRNSMTRTCRRSRMTAGSG